MNSLINKLIKKFNFFINLCDEYGDEIMNGITLITKTKITSDKVSELLKTKSEVARKITQDDEHELFMGNFPNNFYIVFDDSISVDDSKCILEQEEKDLIPFEEAQLNYLNFHNLSVAKRVVKVIKEVYPELIVLDDNGTFYNAEEFAS